jgi:hypothetical protein
MNDEEKVRELFAPMKAIDVDGRRFKLDREQVIAALLRAPQAVAAARAARSRHFAIAAIAAGFAAIVGGGSWLALSTRSGGATPSAATTSRNSIVGQPTEQLRISEVSGQVTRQQGALKLAMAPGDAETVSASGELFTAERSEASVTTSDGLELKLFENTRVALADLGSTKSSSLHLTGGSVRCRVPHLAQGLHFSVVTLDAIVIVHGTVFRVTVGGVAGATQTCVQVEEGVVSVQRGAKEERLTSGQSTGCDLPIAGSLTNSGAASPPEVTSNPAQLPTPRPNTSSIPRARAGTLDEENRLFQAGLSSERRGDTGAAATSFQLLLSRYPQSPLAADARAALSRVRPSTP